MTDGLLSGFRALDITDEKGFVCGKVLASLGVDVIKIEPPGGDPARNIPPFYGDVPDPNKNLGWFSFNTDKRSITLNLETAQGQELFGKLVKKADFVLESFTPGCLEGLNLGYQTLSRLNPRVIMTSITPFGQKGPYSRYKGCELIMSAMGGVLINTGEIDRPPVKEVLNSCYFHAGVSAAFGTVIAHYHREMTGEGQQVDVSIQEVTASRSTMNLIAWEYDKRQLKRSGPMNQFGVNPFMWIWPCKDGYLYWQLMGGQYGVPANPALSQWMDEEGFENPMRSTTNWKEFDLAGMKREILDTWQTAIGNFFLAHTKKELDRECKKRDINVCIANNLVDILTHPQLRFRNYWQSIEHPELGIKMDYPGFFFLCSEAENRVRRRAPLIGESNEAVYEGELGLSGAEIAALKGVNVI